MSKLNRFLLFAVVTAAAATSIGLNKDAEGRDFRFYNYNNQFCLKSNGDAIVVAFDCSDATAIFTLTATPTTSGDGELEASFTALKFKHKQSGKCLGHNDSGILGLYDCQSCCNSAKSQEWIQHQSWSSYFMINSNSVWDKCISAGTGLESLETDIFLANCYYYDNSQWWSLWEL